MKFEFIIGALLLTICIAALALSGCTTTEEEGGPLTIIVTIAPQVEMVEAVGGDLIDVTLMVPAGEDPHTYAPTPSQMIDVAEADVYFTVGSGVEFELSHLQDMRGTNPKMEVISCSEGITLLDNDEEYEEEPGHEGHNHGPKDPHIWLSPTNAKQMVETICKGLVREDPDNQATYEANRDAYLAKLDTLISDIHTKLDPHKDKHFLVYHPAWAYFAHEFKIEQLAIEAGGKEPGPAGVAALIDQAKEENITVIFVSAQFPTEDANTIASEIGGEVVMVDPLASNYIENLRSVATEMKKGLA